MHNKSLDLESLNEPQRQAVMHGEGPLLVLAGPGSGKTFTITQRILYLIEVLKVPPEEILVITFTKEAALSMQRRFQKLSDRSLPVNFGTFHSVFYQILRKSNPSHIRQILGESQKKNLLLPIMKKYMEKEQAKENCLSFLNAISFYKNIGSMEAALNKINEDYRDIFSRIFQEYENQRKKASGIDFDDMVYECREMLQKNVSARAEWRRRFSHILMDEFQDINPMQYQVIKLLSGSPHNLFAVGDDDQSIYGFRGSRPACMKAFEKEFCAERILLDINYRSRPPIVKASLKVIRENKERFLKELRSVEEGAGTSKLKDVSEETVESVCVKTFVEKKEEQEDIISSLLHIAGEESCAILFRTNVQMQALAAILNQRGISYEMKEKGGNIYEHFIAKDIMAYLRIAVGEEKGEYFVRILNKPQRNLSREALWNPTGQVSLSSIRAYYDEISVEKAASYELKAKRAFELLEKQINYLKTVCPYLAVQYICKIIGYEGYLEEKCKKMNCEKWEEYQEILAFLKEDAKQYGSLKEWIKAQKQYAGSMENTNGKVKGKTFIQLMTVHASKGLEFDRVIIPDCNERIYPHGSMLDKESVEEERRIFYVAMTRAKKSLELLYLTGTKESPRQPSRFLNPLIKDYSSTISSNSQLSKYSSKASATFSYSSSSSMKPNSGSSLGSSGFSL